VRILELEVFRISRPSYRVPDTDKFRARVWEGPHDEGRANLKWRSVAEPPVESRGRAPGQGAH